MLNKLKQLLEFSSKNGLYLPSAFDADKQGPSVSLLFAHISFYIAVGSVITLIHKDANLGTVAAMILACLYFVFYLMRRLTKAKFDLDDKSIDLENGEGKDEK